MREQAAAAFLSVTPRTVRNYRRRGLLPFRQMPGKTCPIIDYDPADVARLKASLRKQAQEKAGRKAAAKPPPRPLPRVTFGLPPDEFAALCAEAERLDLKPGEVARRLMREAMESRLQADIDALRAQDEKNAGEIKRLRREVAAAAEAILETTGLTPGQAKAWVTENLR